MICLWYNTSNIVTASCILKDRFKNYKFQLGEIPYYAKKQLQYIPGIKFFVL